MQAHRHSTFSKETENFSIVKNDPNRKSENINFDDPFDECNFLCMRCNKNRRVCFLLNCGHKCFCKRCADSLMNNKNMFCPICLNQIENCSKGIIADEMCVICYEKKPNCIIVPCGCTDCLKNWFSNKDVCPVCLKEKSSFVKIID